MQNTLKPSAMNLLTTLGGRIQCLQCAGTSRRTGQQCRAPALTGKTKCKFHNGPAMGGPKTAEGRQRCAAAKTVTGESTRAIRAEYSRKAAELRELEELGHALALMTGGRTVGRKPTGE